jgi:hypothetical protein
MALVRDPDFAARYAADPAQTIHDAHLVNVTSADVANLIPMVSDSLSMAHSSGGDAFGADPSGNVWASGAATAAFDAFDPGPSAPVVADFPHSSTTGVIQQPDAPTHSYPGSVADAGLVHDPVFAGASTYSDNPVIDDASAIHSPDAAPVHDWSATVADDHHVDDHHVHGDPHGATPGFDIFS